MTDYSSPSFLIPAAFFGVIIVCGFLSSFLSSRRLKRWAEEEGVTVLKKRYAAAMGSNWYAPGLFAGWCYYVTIEDREKRVFSGWVRAGGLLAFLLSARFEVLWDNRPGYLQK